MADQPSAQDVATQQAIRNLQAERDNLVKIIATKQARIEVLDRQLGALRTGPQVAVTPSEHK